MVRWAHSHVHLMYPKDNYAHLITTAITTLPINLPVRRDSTNRSANTDLDAVEEGAGLGQGSPDSLDRALDEASDRDIDSAEFSALWPSTSEDEADRRSPRPHSILQPVVHSRWLCR